MNRTNFITLAGFQVVWLACALGAAWGSNLPGIVASGSYLLALAFTARLDRADFETIVVAGLSGLLAESLFAVMGLVSYSASWPAEGFAPPWIVALWVAFGATISPTLQMLGKGAIFKGAALGLLFGPVAYTAGERLGALSMLNTPILSLAALAIFWATIFPALLYFRAGRSRR